MIPSQSQSQSQSSSQSQQPFSSTIQMNFSNNSNNDNKKSKPKKSDFIKNSYKTSRRRNKKGVKRQYSPDAPLNEKESARKKRKIAEKRKLVKNNKKSVNNNNENNKYNQQCNVHPKFYITKHIDDINYKIETHDCGRRNVICKKCNSQMWLGERLSKDQL